MTGRPQRIVQVSVAAVAGAMAVSLAAAGPAAADASHSQHEDVTFMTRNILLGADLGPAFEANSLAEFASTVGDLLDQVKATNMRQRAKGLADEIHERMPDIIGLQEVALWRTGPVNVAAVTEQEPTASDVYQDFLRILLDRVNKKQKLYKVASVAHEFDFEAPANTDGDVNTGVLPGALGAEIDARLTMRDAILIRRGQQIRIRKASNHHFSKRNSFTTKVLGLVEVTSVRGWQRMDVKVRNSPWIRYGNVHLEAFDDRTVHPSIRSLQAQEFIDGVRKGQRRDGTRMPLVISGDFNSDYPGLVPGDQQAYRAIISSGFTDIGTTSPWSCCISGSDDMQTGGSMSDWDHRVDQFFTNTERKARSLRTWVTGRQQSHGFWHSDHAGVVNEIRISNPPPSVTGFG